SFDQPTAGAWPVCRYYLPPPLGNSHFLSASVDECIRVLIEHPGLVFESVAVMYVGLPNPQTGACAFDWTPIYRLWNARADTNHRYTTDVAVRDAMLVRGYLAEGYGSPAVNMCAAPAGVTVDAPKVELTVSSSIVVAPATVFLTAVPTATS